MHTISLAFCFLLITTTAVVSAQPAGPAGEAFVPSLEKSFASLAEAVKAAGAGGEVRLKPGVFKDAVEVTQDIKLVGEGDAKTIIVWQEKAPCIRVKGGSASVSGLTLSGGETAVHVIGSGSQLTLTNCTVQDAKGAGLLGAAGAAATVEATVFHKVNAQLMGKGGIVAEAGSTLTLRRARLSQAQLGLQADGAATIDYCGFDDTTVNLNGKATMSRSRLTRTHLIVERGDVTVEKCAFDSTCRVAAGGKATLRGSTLTGNRFCFVVQGGKATLEGCDLSKAMQQVNVVQKGEALLSGCTLHDGEVGVGAGDKGRVTVDNCTIRGMTKSGVTFNPGGGGIVKSSTITGCAVAVSATEGSGKAKIEGCTLTGNQKAFEIHQAADIQKTNNKE